MVPCTKGRCALLIAAALLGHSSLRVEAQPGSRPRLDLDGTWEFRMDPRDEGLSERWFGADAQYPDRIGVPGNWQAQGFGDPRGHLRHDYQGLAWYRRAIRIPAAWAGKRIWLHLGGVASSAAVFVNGQEVGLAEDFLTPYEFDVTPTVQPGAVSVLACRVDSDQGVRDPHGGQPARPAPAGMFSFIGLWGGLYGRVWLEARSDPAIDSVFVMPDVHQAMARIRVVLRRASADGPWRGRVLVSISPVRGGPVCEAEGEVAFGADEVETQPVHVDVPVREMHTWSPEDPFLYGVAAQLLCNGEVIDRCRDRFGMRQVEVGEGGALLLNGEPYFVRGLGDDCVEVIHGTLPPDKRIYLDRIGLCKRYGYNAFRFLAHTPTTEIFDAADEAGFLIMAEAPAYGNRWPRQEETIPLLKRQVERVFRTHCNHPSWYAWSAGNEFMDCEGPAPNPDWMEYVHYAHRTFRGLDPTRFFVASEGVDVFPADIVTKAAKFAPRRPPEQPFDGWVDEVAYFRRALSQAEMRSLATPSAAYADLVASLQPRAFWRLNEEQPGTVADASGNGHSGSHADGVRPDDMGQPGALSPHDADLSLRTGASGRSVGLANVAESVFAHGNEPFSLSMWVKPAGFRKGDWGTPLSYGATSDGCALLVSLDGLEGTGKVVLGRWWKNLAASQGRLTAGQWNHVGVTYDGETLQLSLNGTPDTATDVGLTTVVRDARIGRAVVEAVPDEVDYQSLPHIWHEFNNKYVGPLPDLTIDRRYTGVFRDSRCISLHREQVAELGLTERYDEIRQRSIDLFYLYLKQMYEGARRSSTLDGYAYWLMTDIPGGVEGDHHSLGIFSTLYEPEKFPDPDPILRFNGQTALFISAGPGDRVVAHDRAKAVSIGISHYGEKPIRDGRLLWRIVSGGRTVEQGSVAPVAVDVGEVTLVAELAVGPYEWAEARKLTLRAHLESGAARQQNAWDLWTFPAKSPRAGSVPAINLTRAPELDGRYGAGSGPDAVVIADRLTDEIVSRVRDGGSLVLVVGDDALARPTQFTYWAEWIRSVGNFVEDHPALRGFPHDGFCAYQFIRLFGSGLEALDLTDAGRAEREKMRPVVWGMKTDYDPALGLRWSNPKNRWRMVRAGLVCEARAGEGRILVCCLHVLDGVRRGLPEAGYLLDCLVEYANSSHFDPPTTPLDPTDLQEVFRTE